MKSMTQITDVYAPSAVTRSPLAIDRVVGIRSVPAGMRRVWGEVCPQATRLLAATGISDPATGIRTTVFVSAPGRDPGGPPA